LNSFLVTISFGVWTPQPFLHHEVLALPAIIVLSIWQGMGFQMVLLLAGLQSIPQRLYEAAAIDGAGSLHQFLHVTLPGLRNPLIFVVVVTAILAFRAFDQVQILTQGGPRNATTTVIYETYTAAFERLQIGRACAMTVLFFLVVLAITAGARTLMKQQGEFR
jgi:multiple sugar transport system permease protein